jgi:hypothetical protein
VIVGWGWRQWQMLVQDYQIVQLYQGLWCEGALIKGEENCSERCHLSRRRDTMEQEAQEEAVVVESLLVVR